MKQPLRLSYALIAIASGGVLLACGESSDEQTTGDAGGGTSAGGTAGGGAGGTTTGGTSGSATGGTAGSATSGAGGSGPAGGTVGSGGGRSGASGGGQGGRGGSAGSATGGGGVAGVWDCTDAPPDLCFCNHQDVRTGTDHCSTTYECCFGTATSCECADRATCDAGLSMGAMSVPKCPPDP